MPADHVGQGGGERLPIEHAVQVERPRDVVLHGRSLDLVKDPQSLLREGQRQMVRPLLRDQRRPLVDFGLAQHASQARHGGRFEQQRKRDPLSEHGTNTVQQPHREQGMTAQIEEAVVGTNRRKPEYLRHQAAQ